MRLLYIIGNGLDIALHMATSYQDFFKYYLKLPTTDKDIKAMKQDIDSHKYDTWSDLEMGLGAYSSKCAEKRVFLKCLTDIKQNLREYLKKESERIGQFAVSSTANFINPGNFLDPEPRTIYDKFRNNESADVSIDVITLNYTETLETLFGVKKKFVMLSQMTSLQSVLHIHGTLNEMMCMGVNDSSQISNVTFISDDDVVEDFIKPEFNDACMNNKNAMGESLIEKADIIVLYGTSLGSSDKKWWRLIGERMNSDNYPLLVYLAYDKDKDQLAEPNHMRRWTKAYLREIKEKFDIKIEDPVLASRVCVALNKKLFPLTANAKSPIRVSR